jgi:3-hydroxyacyl-[acyl-carrier-protein] dehydratase
MRWLWIDRFLEFDSGKRARAIKNLSLAEDYFTDHFPGYPVMPASLILEGLAQTGGILVGEVNDFREKVVLAKISWCKFHREALPGQPLVYDVEMIHLRPEGATVGGKVHVADELVAEAEIFFAHLDQARTPPQLSERNFVFGGELKQLLGLAQIAKK